MYRSLLLALDDTPGAIAARDLCLAMAHRLSASVSVLSVLDHPHTTGAHEAVPLGGAAFAERRNQARAAAVAEQAAASLAACRSAAGAIGFVTLESEDAPEPALLAAGSWHDLIIIGRDSTLGAESCEDGLSPTIEALLRDGARPLLVVPPAPLPDEDGPVIVAYDGSMSAMRTAQLFAVSGLAGRSTIKILGFGEVGQAQAPNLARYFAAHGYQTEGFAVEGGLEEIALAEARTLPASMLVLGATGVGGLARLIFGSMTARLLRGAPCPVFIHG
jgi:nucleotide-binding universal stress UspA family protein